jgi:ATP-dependent Clp protease ATP-binding subunit ClpC
MFRKFTQRARNAVIHAQEEARQLGHPAIGTEHILLGLLKEGEGIGARTLLNLGIDRERVKQEIDKVIGQKPDKIEAAAGDLPITPRAKKVFNLAFDEARLQGVNYVGTEHLLLAVLREEEGVAGQVLISMGVRLGQVREQVRGEGPSNISHNHPGQEPASNQISHQGKRKTRSKTPTVDAFSRDLTIYAQEGRLDPVIGRNSEIERVIQVLSRRTKNNPVLI